MSCQMAANGMPAGNDPIPRRSAVNLDREDVTKRDYRTILNLSCCELRPTPGVMAVSDQPVSAGPELLGL